MTTGSPPPESMHNPHSRIQFKLTVGAPDDAMEKEADSVADQVVQRMPIQPIMGIPPAIQRKCAACQNEDQEEATIQKSSATNAGAGMATPAVTRQIQATQGSGQSMDGQTRSFMESSFGRDFSQVRIHASGYASQLNRDLQAHAFTIGTDIYFNSGKYAPESKAGQHLLAHELTHVVQQTTGIHRSPMIQRACDTAAYDTQVTAIRALPLFTAIPAHADAIYTPAQAQSLAETIMTDARTRDNCMYYADKLHLLFSTAENPPSTIAAAFGPIMAAAEAAESTRLAPGTFGATHRLAEENAAADPARVYESIAGQGGKTFQIDRRDPANVFVKAKVFPTGDATAVGQLIATEDAIEKRASVLGYTVDLDFVTAAGADVFEVGVDPGAWPTSGNWVLGPDTSAHELHHLLGLPDRYNYIEDHSPNADMYIANRIHWFNEEFRRTLSPLIGRSFMGGGSLIMDEDICETMQAPDMAACLASRRTLRQPGIDAQDATRTRILRIVEILENVSTTEAERTSVQTQATAALGAGFVEADLIANLRTIADVLGRAEIQMENASGTECETATVTFTSTPAAYVLCPAFGPLSPARKAHDFIKVSSIPTALSITRVQELARFIEQVFTPTPVSPVVPQPPIPQVRPTSLLLGGGGGTDALALMELQQRIYTFAPRTPGGLTIPIGLQGVLGLYAYPNRGGIGASLGVGADFQLAGRNTGTPLTFGLTGGGGGTIGGTGIGMPEPDNLELGAYARGGAYGTIGPVRITPQYQFNFLRNMGAGTDTQLHQFLLQLGYTF